MIKMFIGICLLKIIVSFFVLCDMIDIAEVILPHLGKILNPFPGNFYEKEGFF